MNYKLHDEKWRILPYELAGIRADMNFKLEWEHTPSGVWYTYYVYATEAEALAALEDMANGIGGELIRESANI